MSSSKVITEDIFANLDSFVIDVGLSAGEKDMFYLRKRNYILEAKILAYSSYLLSAIMKVNEKVYGHKGDNASKFRTAGKKRTSLNKEDAIGFKVGIIGGGRIGKMLLRTILKYNKVASSSVTVSTRRPENLESFKSEGVTCIFDNKKVAEECDVFFLCCLPSHFQEISQNIKGHIKGLVVSIIGGIPLKKQCYVLNYRNIIGLEFTLPSANLLSTLTITNDVISMLGNKDLQQYMFPRNNGEEDVKFLGLVELLVFACVNITLQAGWSQGESQRIVHSIIFGEEKLAEGGEILRSVCSFLKSQDTPEKLQSFDLTSLQENTFNRKRLYSHLSDDSKNLFWSQYSMFFNKMR